jgi:photosystem II stability/assembly factor-like uncharacterized protein
MKSVQVAMLVIYFAGVFAIGSSAGPTVGTPQAAAEAPGQAKTADKTTKNEIYGTIREIKGSRLTIENRAGKLVQVDAQPAVRANRSAPLVVGHAIDAVGTLDKAGVFHADSVQHAKDSSTAWPADR